MLTCRFKNALWGCLILLFSFNGWAADFSCSVIPQDSIHIKTSVVEVYGSHGSLAITPDGNVSRNGVALSVSNGVKSQAKAYQSGLRKELPYVYNGINQQINQFHNTLDTAISKKFGAKSKTRAHLGEMKSQLVAQLNRVLTPTKDGIIFNAEAVKSVEKDGQAIIQQRLGAIVQDGINEMGSQGLQGLLGGLDGLQSTMQQAWQTQINQSKAFANETCGKVRRLEDQKQALIKALP
jgi:hypothetical protein